jgi:cytochrome b561
MRWRNSDDGWGAGAIALHWLSALLVFTLFGLGLWMVELTYYHTWYHQGPALHKGLGFTLFVLVMVRVIWRHLSPPPPPLPSHKPMERIAARLVHLLLYLLLFAQMISGYLISTAEGRGIEVFGLITIPATLSGIEQQEEIAGDIHLVLAWSLITLVLLHAAAALKHHFIDRDRTLRRMLGR